MLITLQDALGVIRLVSVTDMREQKEGVMMTALASAETRAQMWGADLLTQEWWKPLAKKQIEQIALEFGYLCSESRLSPMPEEWLAPRMSDYVYCDFSLQNGQMLALLVRPSRDKAHEAGVCARHQ